MTRPLDQLRVLSQAHAVALQAKCAALRQQDVAILDKACGVLPEDDPMRDAIRSFVTSAATYCRRPQPMIEAGAALQRAVIRALWVAPSDRRDLNG